MRIPLFAATLTVALPALAHHGFTGRYDTTTPLYLQGEVTSAVWGFPHAVLEVTLAADAAIPAVLADTFGAGLVPLTDADTVTVEFPPVAEFNNLEDRIASGDSISMVVLRNCDPPNQLRAQWVAPAEGEPVLRSRVWQDEVAGC
jgi:hypothetical protein